MLDLNFDITPLRGAEYNPRRISPDDAAKLDESISRLGVVKPIIARGNLIVAGHQRTKALRRLGIIRAPVYVLPKDVTTYDEIRFNQLHNGTDVGQADEDARISGDLTPGYQIVAPDRITGNAKAQGVVVRAEIMSLILAYGPWGGVVATQSGEVIHASQYALAAMITRTPLTVFCVEDARRDEYVAYLSRSYGVFSYDHLERHTYIQSLAQMFRLRESDEGEGLRSTLYESMVIPWLRAHPTAEVLDFGSGQGDYVRKLRTKGYAMHEVELFRRAPKVQALDLTAIKRMVGQMAGRVRAGRLYDAVVCDSVLNSVDTLDAERSVMVMLNALTPMGGRVFFSGRRRETVDTYLRQRNSRNHRRFIEFLDEHNFSVIYRGGHWFYQKLHTAEQSEALAKSAGLEIIDHCRKRTASWQIEARKVNNLPNIDIFAAIDYEFNLPISPARRLGLNETVAEAFRHSHSLNPAE